MHINWTFFSTIAAMGLALTIGTTPVTAQATRDGASPGATSESDDFTSGWRLCNRTDYESVWVAYSYFEDDQWVTKGWRKIANGECSVFQDEITNQYAYYYASNFDGAEWTGDLDICAHETEKFEYFGEMGTCQEGYKVYPFYKFDFEDFEVATRDLVSDGDDPSDEFTSGWRLCNKTDYPSVWVAYSFWENEDWVTKGWRKIDNGECSVFQDEITNRYAYYYASDFDGHEWTGDLDLCAHETEKFEYTGEMGTCHEGYKTYPFYKFDFGDDDVATRDLVSE